MLYLLEIIVSCYRDPQLQVGEHGKITYYTILILQTQSLFLWHIFCFEETNRKMKKRMEA